MRQALLPVVAASALATHALAARDSLSLSLAEQRLAQPAENSDSGEPPAQPEGRVDTESDAPLTLDLPARRFGEAGTWWSGFGAMGTLSDDATDARADFTVRTFLADNFEFNLSLSGWGFFQDGQDAAGINPGLAFRWHFVNDHDRGYSVYAQTGIGLLWANDEVPDEGTRFNFTPHVGIGTTIALGDSPARLDLGIGWHHISNASTSGSDDNPARDSVAVWVGVMFPF